MIGAYLHIVSSIWFILSPGERLMLFLISRLPLYPEINILQLLFRRFQDLFLYADNVELCAALQRLTDKQLRRLYARYFLNMKYTDIAKRENVNESTIRCSIQSALSRLEKSIKKS